MIEKNFVNGILVFMLFLGIPIFIYGDLQSTYGFTSTTSSSPLDILYNTTLVNGFNEISGISEAIGNFAVDKNILTLSFEVLTGATLGIAKLIVGLAIIPLDVTRIVSAYFGIPPQFGNLLGLIAQITVVFIIYDVMRRR